MSLWRKENGVIVKGSTTSLVRCDTCPCDTVPTTCPCDEVFPPLEWPCNGLLEQYYVSMFYEERSYYNFDWSITDCSTSCYYSNQYKVEGTVTASAGVKCYWEGDCILSRRVGHVGTCGLDAYGNPVDPVGDWVVQSTTRSVDLFLHHDFMTGVSTWRVNGAWVYDEAEKREGKTPLGLYYPATWFTYGTSQSDCVSTNKIYTWSYEVS